MKISYMILSHVFKRIRELGYLKVKNLSVNIYNKSDAGQSGEGSDQMETITIILNSAPYGDEKVWNALRLAMALTSAAIKMKVNIFLIGDAVTTAKKGQKPPEGYYHLEKMLKDLIEQGVKVVACRTCINARGLTQEDLVEGTHVGTTVQDLAVWVKESQKVLSF